MDIGDLIEQQESKCKKIYNEIPCDKIFYRPLSDYKWCLLNGPPFPLIAIQYESVIINVEFQNLKIE